jgi:transcription-repair coupling factor (superfamily II helicase)
MAMIGIRDMSVISEPPDMRHPVQTYVLEYDKLIVQNAIEKELARGGQIFYLFNRVAGIYRVADKLKTMFPEANVAVAHGQMSEHQLENVMMDVDSGEADILVCTTIIETGLDIPNVNTIIVENADRMGLAQLYQLRGRVGRSDRLAYAYLTFTRDKSLSEAAEKRLVAIKEFTEFGSGFRIALRDLEIRGAGNLLGGEQHGFMEAIGFDMYNRLLEDAVAEAKGIAAKSEREEALIDLPVNAYIPESYIENTPERITAYKMIAQIENNDDRLEVTEQLIDRYGDIPETAAALMDVAELRVLAESAGVTEVSLRGGALMFYLSKKAPVDMEKISAVVAGSKGKCLFSAGEKPYLHLKGDFAAGKELISLCTGYINMLG